MNKLKKISKPPILFVLLTALFSISCHYGASNQKPNVILIVTDDQGYGDMSCTGNPWIKTPIMDDLYNSSVVFQNFHVDPTCAPTRAALMTGRYSARVGVWMTYMGRHHLNKDETTMADVFAQNGYKTAIFGKWHLGDNFPFRPGDRGFQESLVHGGGVIGETPDFWGNDYYDDTYRRNNRLEKVEGYCTDVWFEEAKAFVRKNKKGPFFLYLPLNAPHGPLNVPRHYVEPYLHNPEIPESRAWFYGMIAVIDERLGDFQAFLREQKLEENTVFMFMSDNGTATGYSPRDGSGYNAGMRGRKGSPYEGGHRVPFMLRWPKGGIDSFREINHLTAHIDLLPTLIDLLHLKSDSIAFDGKSLVPLLRSDDAEWPDRAVCVHNQITFGQKLANDLPVKYKKYAVMTDRWRLVNGELYDMWSDPGQQHDVAAQFPGVARELADQYEQWWADISPSFDHYNSTIVGAPQQRVVELSSQFWHGDDAPYSQDHVRAAMQANGFWDIDVAVSGEYVIELRRWPRELDLAMQAAVPKPRPDTTKMWPSFALLQLPSRAIDVTSARLKVGEVDQTVPVRRGQKRATFKVHLDEGEQFVQTWLTDRVGTSRGAYYVYIEPLKLDTIKTVHQGKGKLENYK